MAHITAFYGIDKQDVKKLLNTYNANIIDYKVGSTVLSNLTNTTNIYIVLEGEVQIIRYNFDGSKTILANISNGDIFGSFSSSEEEESYAITTDNSKIVSFNYEYLINRQGKYIQVQNKLMDNIIKILANKIRDLNIRTEILTEKTIRNKLLKYFNYLSRIQITKDIILPFTLSDLADYLSIDRSAMMREIKSMKEDGLLESKGKYFRLYY